MSKFSKAEQNDQPASERHGNCKICDRVVKQDQLMDFGARCYPCYQAYCKATPDYPPIFGREFFELYGTDNKRWARALIDKHKQGQRVHAMALKMANEALKSKEQNYVE